MRLAALILTAACVAVGQGALEFEAVSVKPVQPPAVDPMQPSTMYAAMQQMRGGPGTSTPGRIRYVNVTAMALIMKAYEVTADQVAGGPGWLTEDKYSIDAVVPQGATKAQFLEMLRSLLVKRFGLTFRWGEREFQVYRLRVGKGGPKLEASSATGSVDDDDPAYTQAVAAQAGTDAAGCPVLPKKRRASVGRAACSTFIGWSMEEFAQLVLAMAIAQETGQRSWAKAIDETGLNGRYDFHLHYDMGYHVMLNSPNLPQEMREKLQSSNPISIFKAVEELGLTVEPGTAKLKVMTIERIERKPVEN